MSKMKIEIWSDIACPYCYIGKRKLEKALSRFQYAGDIHVTWRSYVLNADLPKGKYGKPYFEYLASIKNTTAEDEKKSFEEIQALAEAEGLNFDPEKIQVTNTTDALRFVKLANKYNMASDAEEALFSAYFIEGRDIGDKDTLVSIGIKLGIPQADVIRSLDCFEYSEDVKKDTTEADEKHQLEYIPFYLLNNKFVIQGSVPVDDYLKILHDAYNDWKDNGQSDGSEIEESIKGKSCSADGTCSI